MVQLQLINFEACWFLYKYIKLPQNIMQVPRVGNQCEKTCPIHTVPFPKYFHLRQFQKNSQKINSKNRSIPKIFSRILLKLMEFLWLFFEIVGIVCNFFGIYLELLETLLHSTSCYPLAYMTSQKCAYV